MALSRPFFLLCTTPSWLNGWCSSTVINFCAQLFERIKKHSL